MRLIDADELLYRLEKIKEEFLDEGNYIAVCIAKTVIKLLKTEGTIPTIEAEPVRNGRWIDNTKIIEGYPDYQFNCSECNYTVWRAGLTKYCPECGAKMDAKEE